MQHRLAYKTQSLHKTSSYVSLDEDSAADSATQQITVMQVGDADRELDNKDDKMPVEKAKVESKDADKQPDDEAAQSMAQASSEGKEEPAADGEEAAEGGEEKTEKKKEGEKESSKEEAARVASEEAEKAGNSTDGNSTATYMTGMGNGRWGRLPGREDGDFGFDENESVETHPRYKNEMQRILGKTMEMKKNLYGGYGYYGNGGQGSAYGDGGAMDLFEEASGENEKEKEGYYPADDEEEDEMFIHDLHRQGYNGYVGNSYGGYANAYGRRFHGVSGGYGGGGYGGYQYGGYGGGQGRRGPPAGYDVRGGGKPGSKGAEEAKAKEGEGKEEAKKEEGEKAAEGEDKGEEKAE